jgi:hypothetical protein
MKAHRIGKAGTDESKEKLRMLLPYIILFG